jgi:hypothetical protein
VLLASHRARLISSGAPLTIDRHRDKNPVLESRQGESRRGAAPMEGRASPWKGFHGRVPTRFHDDGAAIHRRP